MSKLCQFFFQYKNATEIFIINTPGTMKKSKYQQYLYCFIVCMLVPNAFWFGYFISATFRGTVHTRGTCLFQFGYPKVQRLFEACYFKTKFSISEIYFSSHVRASFSKAFWCLNILIKGYFFIGFIDFMLKGKSLLEYRNLFFLNEYKTNDNMIFKYFQ